MVDISGDLDEIELGPSVAKRPRQSPEPILMDENRLDLVTVEIEAKVNRMVIIKHTRCTLSLMYTKEIFIIMQVTYLTVNFCIQDGVTVTTQPKVGEYFSEQSQSLPGVSGASSQGPTGFLPGMFKEENSMDKPAKSGEEKDKEKEKEKDKDKDKDKDKEKSSSKVSFYMFVNLL